MPEAPLTPGCTASTERAAQVGEMARGEVAAMLAAPGASFAQPYPASTIPKGAPVSVADSREGRLLVNLWATWCAPCRAEMPALDRLEQEMGGESFEVVAVNIDTGSDEKPRAFLDEIGVSALGYYRDATMGVFNDLSARVSRRPARHAADRRGRAACWGT